MKEKFIDKNFRPESLEMIEKINRILDEYKKQGFRLSLRQLYYQLVARDIIENSLRSYKNIGNLVSQGRQAGHIDWNMIEDRNRDTVQITHWKNPAEIVTAAAKQFRIDKREDQFAHIEVMVEKDALSGVLEPVCRNLDIAITANKGYCSSSIMYEIGKRIFHKTWNEEKSVTIFYLGDHDPSGIDMTRDVKERLLLYSQLEDHELEVVRLALNWEQVEEWNPPENPAKQTDSRFDKYSEIFGYSSWELDAVEPSQLALLVTEAVNNLTDQYLWERAVEKEKVMRAELLSYAESYGKGTQNG